MTQVEFSLAPDLRFDAIDQVAMLVPDLAAGVRAWSAVLGLDQWYVCTYGPESVPECLTYHDEPGSYRMRLALAGSSPQLELIQPLDGPSIYHDWIAEHGYGLHHFGFRVASIAEAERRARAAGIPVIQTGRSYGADGTGGFAYLATQQSLGVITELIEVPAVRRPSEDLR
ncbi:MAG TPA: VOC family protein [Amycolatopsis sp.]|jgi:catechol 2,3-dioxygenase-like lactoylglutathione lyase family enzyme|nr:VOC family protein [Amycolatopsis sp.]